MTLPASDSAAPRKDMLLMTFDALRFDVAQQALRAGRTPFLESLLPDGWEPRHTLGNFTYAAHAAFFAGFWPTPTSAAKHSRPLALRFPGSRSIGDSTQVLEGENILEGLARHGYRTICIGGVGFFSKLTPLGSVLPSLFQESHWEPSYSVSAVHSTREQVERACQCLAKCPRDQPVFLFVNVSATHPPTHGYVPGSSGDSTATQAAALSYVDRQLPPLFAALRARQREGAAFLMSDHGTLFGEDGYTGHRISHALVWTVPYAECTWGTSP